mmetsp:Transcript_19184/g.48770  ORF Transcript_19184/g.48770 Transcript_19184/m.48770 type:complete len:300 (-) Transcript_19184:467-1366(-)
MVALVALAQALEDLQRLRLRRLVDIHRLEAALQRGVALNVLAVLVDRGRAHHLELAAREGGLDEVGDVQPAATAAAAPHGPSAHQGVHLVNHEHHVARLPDLTDHLGHTVLKLAALLGARNDEAHVQLQDALVVQEGGQRRAVRVAPVHDGVSQALRDGGLAHTRLAQQDGVVLGAARQDLRHARHLALAANHGVDVARAHLGTQVLAVLVHHLGTLLLSRALLLGLLCLSITLQALLRLRLETITVNAQALKDAASCRVMHVQHCEQDVLRADEVYPCLLALICCGLKRPPHVPAERY